MQRAGGRPRVPSGFLFRNTGSQEPVGSRRVRSKTVATQSRARDILER